jgi:hypothetical protein
MLTVTAVGGHHNVRCWSGRLRLLQQRTRRREDERRAAAVARMARRGGCRTGPAARLAVRISYRTVCSPSRRARSSSPTGIAIHAGRCGGYCGSDAVQLLRFQIVAEAIYESHFGRRMPLWAVRYRIDGAPLVSGVCHCRTCRKAASAPVLPFLTFQVDQFLFTRGKPADFRSSSAVTRSFCDRCGSPLTYRNDGELGQIDVMTCSLDDPEAFPPTHHVWVGHKIAWLHVADGLPAYDTTRSRS